MSNMPVTHTWLTVRNGIRALTYLLIVLMGWQLFNFSQEIFHLRRHVARVDELRTELDVKAKPMRELEQHYRENLKSKFANERRMEDFFDACRLISDVPTLQTDFIIYKAQGATPPSIHWLYVPQGKHQLQIHVSEQTKPLHYDKQVFSYDLLPESAYRLTLSLPHGPMIAKSGASTNREDEVPILVSIESNHASFRSINQELPMKVHPHASSTSVPEQLQLRFPGESVGARRSVLQNGMPAPVLTFDGKEQAIQLAGFSWTWKNDQARLLFISLEILSDAMPCAEPSTSPQNRMSASGQKIEFAPYRDNGRFELKRDDSH